MSFTYVFLRCIKLFIVIALFSIAAKSVSYSDTPVSYRLLRYTSVEGQTDWYTCGPAALATLFTYYYSVTTSEHEFTTLSVKDMESRGKDLEDGLTLLSLRNASRTKGMDATGYKITPNALGDLLSNGLPVLANVTQPELHFTVVIGIQGDQVLLADPSWGLKVQPMRQFLDSWNGVVLVPSPNQEQQATARAQVAKVLTEYRTRQDRLRAGL